MLDNVLGFQKIILFFFLHFVFLTCHVQQKIPSHTYVSTRTQHKDSALSYTYVYRQERARHISFIVCILHTICVNVSCYLCPGRALVWWMMGRKKKGGEVPDHPKPRPSLRARQQWYSQGPLTSIRKSRSRNPALG